MELPTLAHLSAPSGNPNRYIHPPNSQPSDWRVQSASHAVLPSQQSGLIIQWIFYALIQGLCHAEGHVHDHCQGMFLRFLGVGTCRGG